MKICHSHMHMLYFILVKRPKSYVYANTEHQNGAKAFSVPFAYVINDVTKSTADACEELDVHRQCAGVIHGG